MLLSIVFWVLRRRLGGLSNSVPSTVTNPPLPALPSFLDRDLMQFSGCPGVGLRDPSLLVSMGRGVDVKAGPFRSDSLLLQGVVAGCFAQNWKG